jgi:hypothetical protein
LSKLCGEGEDLKGAHNRVFVAEGEVGDGSNGTADIEVSVVLPPDVGG